MSDAPGADPLDLFSAPVARWFRATFAEPTPPQARGWPAIARGEHALIISPTGSGKTLTAFLWSIDGILNDLKRTPEPERGSRARSDYRPGIRVVYVSPLKALNNDVERNLRVPLAGIRALARPDGDPLPEVRVAVRTGDTPTSDRQKMLRRPPHILITTPESLYLMLTSPRARALFATTRTVIVDEIHTVVGTKRGAHLAITLERLERMAEGRLQRVGLSATVRPVEGAARFLGGQDPRADFAPRPVTAVDAAYAKPLDLRVIMPVRDFRDSPGASVWQFIIPEVARLIDEHRTTLIFCNSRRIAERTADRLNDYRLHSRAENGGAFQPPRMGIADRGIFAAGADVAELEAAGLQPIRAHHGSMSRTARLEMEQALKTGRLRALVCTSSLELGIDVGDVDLVIQLQSPKSVASGLQRVGRSGHGVGQTSVGRIFPTHPDDLVEAAAVCRSMLRGEIEATQTPENPLDVLAQQIVAMVGVEEWPTSDLYALVRGAYPFRNLSEGAYRGVLEMLSGRYPEKVSRQLRALVSWDRVNDRLASLPGTGARAIGSGGTIPDRGNYALVLADRRTRIGELDEEFVFETRPGDTFLLGSSVWRVAEITDDRVVAEPAPGETPRMPFWHGDAPWRPYDLGRRVGAFRRELADLVRDLTPAELEAVRSVDEDDLAAVLGHPAGQAGAISPPPGDPSSASGTDSALRTQDSGLVPPQRGTSPRATPRSTSSASEGDAETAASPSPDPPQGTPGHEPPLPRSPSPLEGEPGHEPPLPRSPSPPRWRGGQGVRLPPPRRLLSFLAHGAALDPNAIVQIVDYVARQLDAAGEIATDRTVVVETFDDAIGDPRVVVHSPFGGRVNRPWGIVLADAIRERLGSEAQVISGDDGVLLRFAHGDATPSTDLVGSVTSHEARERLIAGLPGSATFGAQFRMNAARALLLPRERAGKRTPLWLSRLRAKDLLQAVQGFGDFPITLETYRDCLRDVMDLDGLADVLDRIRRGEIEVIVHESALPSPLALGLDYQFATQYVYEYDAPRGEHQLASQALDRQLLGELLQDRTLAGALTPQSVAEVAARVARTAPNERARGVEELAQILFELGDLSGEEIRDRCASPDSGSWLEALAQSGRALPWSFGAARRWVHAERRSEYEELSTRPEPILRRYLAHAGPTALDDLAARYDLTPDQARDALAKLGSEVAAGQFAPGGGEQWIDRHNLEQMHRRGLSLLRKEVRPVSVHAYAEFLRRWQGVGDPSLLVSSEEPHPLAPSPLRWRGGTAGADSDRWHGDTPHPDPLPLGEGTSDLVSLPGGEGRIGLPPLPLGEGRGEGAPGRGEGVSGGAFRRRATGSPEMDDDEDGPRLTGVLQQLRGIAVPGAIWERDVLPARLGYDPDTLAERCQSGELMWVAEGGRDPRRSRVRFFFRGEGGLFLDRRPADEALAELGPSARSAYEYLSAEGAALLPDIAEGTGLSPADARAALIELVLAGLVTNDSLEALRAVLGYEPPPSAPSHPYSSLEAQLAALRPNRPAPLTRHRLMDARRRAREVVVARERVRRNPWLGRWALVHRPTLLGKPLSDEERVLRQARQLLARWGIVTRACLERESPVLDWSALYQVLSLLELRGEVRRGYFVEGLPGIQFALPEAVEALRAANRSREDALASRALSDPSAIAILSAADPAQLFGSQVPGADALGEPLRFQRVASSAVALWMGEPVAVMEDSGAGVAAVADHPALVPALRALGHFWRPRVEGRLRVERWGGDPVLDSPGVPLLEAAGYVREFGGMLWTGKGDWRGR